MVGNVATCDVVATMANSTSTAMVAMVGSTAARDVTAMVIGSVATGTMHHWQRWATALLRQWPAMLL
jgi:predicted DNA repair protein MutK